MSIHAADALMEIFGFKRVANYEKPLDNPSSLDDDSGSLNEGMKMSEVKNEGLEVVAVYDGKYLLQLMYMDTDEELCRHSEALAGYADRDARIAAQEAQIKVLQSNANSWQSGYDEGRRMGGKHCMLTVDQLRAELAALNAKLDASKFCANVADDLRAELAAIKAQEPLTVEFMQFMTAVVTGAGLLSRGKRSKGLASELSATAYKYMLGAQVSGYQQKPIGYRCWFNKEPKSIMVEWGKSLPSDMNPSATYQALYAAPVSEAKAQEPVDGALLDYCEECSHPEFGLGYFFTDDCVRPLYAAPVAKQVVMPDVTAAAKALCKHHAELCNVNADDQWNVYSQDFIADAEIVLANSRLNAADQEGDQDE